MSVAVDEVKPAQTAMPPLNRLDAASLASVKAEYEADGASVIRNVIPKAWLERLAKGTEQILRDQEGAVMTHSREGGGRFVGSVFSYLRIPEYREFVMTSGVGRLAAELMGSNTARFFYDQPLIKEPGAAKRTPWHQDSAYWPCTGRQVISIWVPLDPATPETGVVSYVKGSHKWSAYYPPDNFSDDPDHSLLNLPSQKATIEDPGPGASKRQPRTLTDIREHPENYQFTNWSLQPGDVLIHQMETIHGAPGNSSLTTSRRAISFRFFGDDARWDESGPHFMKGMKKYLDFPYPKLETGDVISDPLFPVLWPSEAG